MARTNKDRNKRQELSTDRRRRTAKQERLQARQDARRVIR